MSYNNAYGINEDGKLAVRVIGAGGGGQVLSQVGQRRKVKYKIREE